MGLILNRIVLFSFCILVMACGTANQESSDSKTVTAPLQTWDVQLKTSYAQGFTLAYHEGYKLVEVLNPWDNYQVLQSYALVPKTGRIPDNIPADSHVIRIPISKTICLSSTHVGAIAALGLDSTIIGINNPDYINNLSVLDRAEQGTVHTVGGLADMSIERVLDIEPDLIMISAMETSATQTQKLKNVDIPFALNIEWMEKHPLGKTEWIKFVAAFYDAEEVANTKFELVAKAYNDLTELTAKVETRPVVLMGTSFKSVWHMPGGSSFAAKFIADAGGTTPWLHLQEDRLKLTLEEVMDKALDANYWLNPSSCKSKSELKALDERYALFAPFKQEKIFNNNARLSAKGANDYWESGIMNPSAVLADLIHILHPELLPEHELYYYQAIN